MRPSSNYEIAPAICRCLWGKKLYSAPPLPGTFFPRNQPASDRIISPRRSMNLESETHCYPFHTLVGHSCVAATNCTKPHVAPWWGSQSHVGVFRDLFIDTSIGCRISQGKEVRYHTGNTPVFLHYPHYISFSSNSSTTVLCGHYPVYPRHCH